MALLMLMSLHSRKDLEPPRVLDAIRVLPPLAELAEANDGLEDGAQLGLAEQLIQEVHVVAGGPGRAEGPNIAALSIHEIGVCSVEKTDHSGQEERSGS